jgi:hypothetical protein
MFRAAHRSSSGALNCICSLWFIYPCGDRPLPRLNGKCLFVFFSNIVSFILSSIQLHFAVSFTNFYSVSVIVHKSSYSHNSYPESGHLRRGWILLRAFGIFLFTATFIFCLPFSAVYRGLTMGIVTRSMKLIRRVHVGYLQSKNLQ